MSANWPRVLLGELLHPISRQEAVQPEKTYRLLGVRWYAKGLFVKDEKTGGEIRANSVYRVEAGDFVYNRLFAWMGSFAVADLECDGCYVSNEFPCYRVNTDRLDGRFLWMYFSRVSAWSEALGLSSGGTPTSRNRLKEEKLLQMLLPLPPLAEQRRIVSRVDAIAARIADARRLRKEAETESTLIPAKAREALILPIFNCTPQHPLGEVTDTRLGKMLSAEKKLGISPAPYLRNANIHDDRIELSSVYQMDFLIHELDTFRLQAGDILINEGGYGVGRCAVWEGQIQPCYFQKSLHRVRVDNSRISPRFLMHQLIWAKDTGLFDDITKATTFQHLTGVRLKRHPVVIPDLAEQRRIVAHLDALQAKTDALRSLQAEASAELDALLPAVLAKAFAGEL